ncbi:MAG: DUF2062 domain-containing protein [Opitutales bacterium]|nr:DUF2062 domain-containing protein [Opitutales bacterium]
MRWFRLRSVRFARRRRERARAWLRAHPRVTLWLEWMGCMHIHDAAVSRGVSAGLFIALTPTAGIQTLLILIVCLIFRANFVAAFAMSWVCNPLTVGPLYFAYHSLGKAVFGWLIVPLIRWPGVSGEYIEDGAFMVAGSLLIAPAAAVGGFFLASWFLRRRRLRRRRGSAAKALPPNVTPEKGSGAEE